MPAISTEDFVPWANYHLSVGRPKGSEPEPQLAIERLARVHVADQDGMGIERFAETATILWDHLSNVETLMRYKEMQQQLGSPPQPFPLALTGRAWSFSDVIGAGTQKPCPAMLILDGLAGVVLLGRAEKHADFEQTPMVLAGGGTRLRELAAWAGRQTPQLSIINSGTYLGMTIGGAIGTASHGGRIGRRGLHDMVHGLHIITGIDESVWIERESKPGLGDAAIDKLAPAGHTLRKIRDDAMFADALVHLGCMGIINAVALELEPEASFDRINLDRQIDAQWLEMLAAGNWAKVAQGFKRDDEPIFYELTINPDHWNGASALHIGYFASSTEKQTPLAANIRPTADVIGTIGEALLLNAALPHHAAALPVAGFKGDPVDMRVFLPSSRETSVFEKYRKDGDFNPSGTPQRSNWLGLHPGEITGGYPGSLWNASFAIDRRALPVAIPAICEAVKKLPQSFVFTLRFVQGDNIGLAFTRFENTAVIEVDGLSPWICQKVAQRWINGNGGNEAGIEEVLDQLSRIERTLPLGGALVAKALKDNKIDFSNHWGKLGQIRPDDVHAAFGNPADPQSRLGRWRHARDAILTTPLARAIFWNWGAVRMGVLDRPQAMPW